MNSQRNKRWIQRAVLTMAALLVSDFLVGGISVQAAVISLSPPLSDALSRITKKTFGLYIDPRHSPVSPERFRGYHTGVDFETTPEEQKADVPVAAICTGRLVLKKRATGYGGVAVQRCTINRQAVTVVYGHLRLASISTKVGTMLKAGEQFAVLGTGYSAETDGERKHFHLGIHKGTAVSILGYVQRKSDLKNWIDPVQFFLPTK